MIWSITEWNSLYNSVANFEHHFYPTLTGDSQAATESRQNNSSDSQNTNNSPNAGASTNPNPCANDHDEDGEEPPEERPIQLKRAHEEEQVIIHYSLGSKTEHRLKTFF